MISHCVFGVSFLVGFTLFTLYNRFSSLRCYLLIQCCVSIFAFSLQSRSPRHSQSTQSGLADQAAKLSFASAESLETMSEADVPVGFNRMNRFRQSLPLSRSASQNKLRSPGYWDSSFNHLLDWVRSFKNLKTVILFILKAQMSNNICRYW